MVQSTVAPVQYVAALDRPAVPALARAALALVPARAARTALAQPASPDAAVPWVPLVSRCSAALASPAQNYHRCPCDARECHPWQVASRSMVVWDK